MEFISCPRGITTPILHVKQIDDEVKDLNLLGAGSTPTPSAIRQCTFDLHQKRDTNVHHASPCCRQVDETRVQPRHGLSITRGVLKLTGELVGVQKQFATDDPHVGLVGLVAAYEIARGTTLNVLLFANGFAPISDDAECISVMPIRFTHGVSHFNDIDSIVGLRFTHEPTITLDGGDVVFLQQSLGRLLPCIAGPADADDHVVAKRFSAFEGIHEELRRDRGVNDEVRQGFGLDGLRFSGNFPSWNVVWIDSHND